MSTRMTGAAPAFEGARTVVTVGTFDGVHRGHLDVLERVVRRARETARQGVLVTFDPHPLEVVRPDEAPALLTVGDEKLEVLAGTGLDRVVVLPFTRTLQAYPPRAFVELLRTRYGMEELLIGHDHGFGHGRAGGAEIVRALGGELGFAVDVVAPVTLDGQEPVSSSRIRRAILAGDLARAAMGLGRHYSVGGRVVQGDRRGRLLGYPTINLEPASPRKLLPALGVYAVRAFTPLGAFGGMLNLGPRPTFGDARTSLEVHLFDTAGDLYGTRVRVEFVRRLRDTAKFADVAALVAQLGRDAEAARQALGATPARVDAPSGRG